MEALESNHKPSTKRSRVVVSQSRRGCVTCKTRRVKCDEEKPLCRRCIQAGRLCGGYSHKSKPSSALQPALRTGVKVDNHTERLSHLAAHVLSLNNEGLPVQEDDVWGRVFLQLSNQNECVKAAAAAFGAAYELSLNNTMGKVPASAWRYYGSALTMLQSELKEESTELESLALASLILACVEVLSQHEHNAFTHFLGAVEILTRAYQRRRGAASSDFLNKIKDGVVNANLLLGGYALSQTPQLMYVISQDAAPRINVFDQPELAVNAAMLCLQRSYQFISSASRLQYKHPSWKDYNSVMCEDQSRALAECHSILDGLAGLITRQQAHHSSSTVTQKDWQILAELYALRTQLTANIIFILCIDTPYETAYDEHLDQFRSIVSDAAASARLRRWSKPSAFKRFSTRLGIVSPLYFTILKCRDPALRAVAITMLSEQNREGPADGHILAAIGAQVAALEISDSVPSTPGAPLAACDILEEQRFHGYTVPPPRLDSEGQRVVDVVFARPNPPLAQGWGHADYSVPGGWSKWSVPVEI
uniref:Zn(2)-C6 fungal-type domain-containing protein n=1 Tax=Bionectria ochroleuca TaxID=29856 RepID=A0A8H7TQL8_BIOOC